MLTPRQSATLHQLEAELPAKLTSLAASSRSAQAHSLVQQIGRNPMLAEQVRLRDRDVLADDTAGLPSNSCRCAAARAAFPAFPRPRVAGTSVGRPGRTRPGDSLAGTRGERVVREIPWHVRGKGAEAPPDQRCPTTFRDPRLCTSSPMHACPGYRPPA